MHCDECVQMLGGYPCGHDGDARQNFQKQPLKVTNMGVAPAYFDP